MAEKDRASSLRIRVWQCGELQTKDPAKSLIKIMSICRAQFNQGTTGDAANLSK